MNGYTDIYDYLKKCAPYYRIPDIKQPTMFMNAINDPFTADLVLDYEIFKSNPNTFLATNKYAGHMGYHETLTGMDQWHNKPTLDFFDGLRKI